MNVDDTLTYLENLVERMNKEPLKYLLGPTEASREGYEEHLHASQVVSCKRNDNLNAGLVLSIMLSSIPGISHLVAGNIVSRVGEGSTMRQLVAALEALPDAKSRKKFLMAVDKVGDAKAASILSYLGY